MSKIVLNNPQNFPIKTLNRFKDIAVYVERSFFIAAPCRASTCDANKGYRMIGPRSVIHSYTQTVDLSKRAVYTQKLNSYLRKTKSMTFFKQASITSTTVPVSHTVFTTEPPSGHRDAI